MSDLPLPVRPAEPITVAPTPIRRGVNVSVESDDKGGFWVTRIRHDGASSHATHWSGPELDELIVRAQAARQL